MKDAKSKKYKKLFQTTCEAQINAPKEVLNLHDWVFSLSDKDYQTTARGHIGAGSSTHVDGTRTSVNVESVGGNLLVQHYVAIFCLWAAHSCSVPVRCFPNACFSNVSGERLHYGAIPLEVQYFRIFSSLSILELQVCTPLSEFYQFQGVVPVGQIPARETVLKSETETIWKSYEIQYHNRHK